MQHVGDKSIPVSKFGKADPRARGWENSLDYTLSLLLQRNTPLVSALPNDGDHQPLDRGGNGDTEPHINSSNKAFSESEGLEEATAPGSSSSVSFGQYRRLSGVELLGVDRAGVDLRRFLKQHILHKVSLRRQFEVLVRLISQLATLRRLVGQVKALW